MAGRRAHIGSDRFGEFFESIPEDSRAQGYWRIKKENYVESGGVIQSFLGFIPFNAQESYESLRARIKDQFATARGPGTYYSIPCDDRKRELKDVDQVKVEFTEKEVPVPTPAESVSASDPMKDTMASFKKTQKDMAEIQAMKVQQKLMKQLAGDDDEEDRVKESPGMMGGGMENLLLYRSLFEDKGKKEGNGVDAAAIKDMIEDKLDRKLSDLKESLRPKEGDQEMKALLRALVENQKPKEDSDTKRLLEHLVKANSEKDKESTLQTMFAMQIKQQEERDKVREVNENNAKEERRMEKSRLDEERKLDHQRYQEQIKLEREKFVQEAKERDERFKAEMEIRRAELKTAKENSHGAVSDQQAMQLKFFELMKDGKNSNFEVMKDVFGLMTNSGLTSMKTAQQAAEAIMSIAQKAGGDKEEKEPNTIVELLKGLGSIAGPVLGSMASGDAQMKMLQQIGQMSGGGGGIEKLLAGMGQAPRQAVPPPPEMRRQRPMVSEAPVQAPSVEPKASKNDGGMAMVIVGMLQKYPEIEITMIGNMQEKLGVEMFVDMLYEFDLPGIDKMIAMMPTKFLMDCVKQVCDPVEKKIIDENAQWFADLKRIMLEEVRAANEEEDDEEEIDENVKKVVAEGAKPAAPVPTPVAQAPAPIPAPVPAPSAVAAPQA